jgi:hypothetical protein
MVPVRINANGKALTVEELRTQKKDMHLNAFRYLLTETVRDLERIAEDGGPPPCSRSARGVRSGLLAQPGLHVVMSSFRCRLPDKAVRGARQKFDITLIKTK